MRSITSRAERHTSFKKALLSDDKRAFLLAEDEGFEPLSKSAISYRDIVLFSNSLPFDVANPAESD